ncbi:MAG: universal stress protein [Terrimicrobiaceae bacterium]
MNTLLVPLDFSEATDAVLEEAGKLSKSLDAKVILLHVIEPVASYIPVGASMDVLATPIQENLPDQESIQKSLEKLATRLGTNTACHAVIGTAVNEILDFADSENATYILLGSHGHGALYHLFSGSVVTGVLKKSKRPVVVIPSVTK